jgi:hypothetical protein
MVNKLATIRNQMNRAATNYSGSLRATVVELRRENPMWSLQRIGNVMGLTRERVRQLLKSEGVPTASVKQMTLVRLTCGYCAAVFERPTARHLYNQSRGFVGTYCSTQCQRRSLGQMQHERGAAATECRNHHVLTPANVIFISNQNKTGPLKVRRCRTCRNEYARDYYHRQKEVNQNDLLQRLDAAIAHVERTDDNGTE